MNNRNIDHAVRLSGDDHFVDPPDKPDLVRTELSVVVGIEDWRVSVVHELLCLIQQYENWGFNLSI